MRVTCYATTLLFVLAFTQVAAQVVLVPFQRCSLWKEGYLTTINTALGASVTVAPDTITGDQIITLKAFLANYMWMVNQPAYDAVHSGECAELGRQVWKRLGYSADFDVSHPGTAPSIVHFKALGLQRGLRRLASWHSAKHRTFHPLTTNFATEHPEGKNVSSRRYHPHLLL